MKNSLPQLAKSLSEVIIMGKTTELMQLLKTGNSDAARKLIAKMKKSGEHESENYPNSDVMLSLAVAKI